MSSYKTIPLSEMDINLPLAEIYDGVDFVPVTIAPARRAVPVSMVRRDTAGSAIAEARVEVVLRNGRTLRVPEGVLRVTIERAFRKCGRTGSWWKTRSTALCTKPIR